MRLSESLRKNVMQAGSGGIINRFKISRRRDVLFFEDILAGYIRACEGAGYAPQMRRIAKEWGFLYVKNFLPEFMESLPKAVLLNSVISKVLMNIGLLSGLRASIEGSKVTLTIREEAVTRCVGKNSFCIGLWEGVLAGLYKRDAEALSSLQSPDKSVYRFSITSASFDIRSKSKARYVRLNSTPGGNGDLKRYLKMRVIVLRDNRMYFRGKSVVLGENTIFHLLGQEKIMVGRIATLSKSCFRGVINPRSSLDSKMSLLKNVLQVFGWGRVKIRYTQKRISVDITGPPYGVQEGRDNWTFLSNSILGYLLLVDPESKTLSLKTSRRGIELLYGIGGVKHDGFVHIA